MSISRKKSNFAKNFRLKNARGQAVLEYVLLMFMIMVVLLAIIVAVAKNTQKFAQNYFGAYFQCLLEMGELPSLGSDSAPETECDDIYEPFSFSDGRPPNFDYDSKSADSGDGKSSDESGDGSSGADSLTSNQSPTPGSSETAGNTIAGNGNIDLGFEGRLKKVPLSGVDKVGKKTGSESDLDNLNGTNNFQEDSLDQDESGRSKYVPIYGTRSADNEEDKKSGVVKANVPQDQELALRGKRVPATVQKSHENNLTADEGLTFPDIIKILIITAIILIIIVFFGGQVMQYNKSKD